MDGYAYFVIKKIFIKLFSWILKNLNGIKNWINKSHRLKSIREISFFWRKKGKQ